MSYWKRVTSPAELVEGQRIRYCNKDGTPEDEMVGMVAPAEFKHWGLGWCGVADDYPFGEWTFIEALFDGGGAPVLSYEVTQIRESTNDRERLRLCEALAVELLPHAVDGMAHCNGCGDVEKWHPAHRELYARAMELLGEQQLSAPATVAGATTQQTPSVRRHMEKT